MTLRGGKKMLPKLGSILLFGCSVVALRIVYRIEGRLRILLLEGA